MFNAVLLATCLYGWWRGGAPERSAAALIAVASFVTYLLPFDRGTSFHQVEWPELAVDATLLLALVGLAMFADRFWPLWLAAVQLLIVSVHFVRVAEGRLLALTYAFVIGKLAYVVLGLLAAGVARHRRRLAAGAPEHDWTFQRRRAGAVPRDADDG